LVPIMILLLPSDYFDVHLGKEKWQQL